MTTLCSEKTWFPGGRPMPRLALWLWLPALFLVYPGFTVCYPFYNARYFESGTLTLWALGLLLLFGGTRLYELIQRLPKFLLIAPAVFLGITIWHTLTHPAYSLTDFGISAIYVILPFFAAVFAPELRKVLPGLMTVFWILNLLLTAQQLFFYHTFPFGLSGNINWNSALLVMTFPFAVIQFRQWIGGFWKKGNPRVILLLSLLIVLIPDLCFFHLIQSRGSLLALAVCAAVACCLYLPERFRKLYCGVLFALFAGGVIVLVLFAGDRLAELMVRNERMILYSGTVDMIFSAPLFGSGFPSFEEVFHQFRPAEYFLHPFCAMRSNHPHNHFLLLAAGTGLIGLTAYAVFLFGTLGKILSRYRELPPLLKWSFFAFLTVLTHGMVDLPMERYPTNLLALLLLGLLLEHLAEKPAEPDTAPPFFPTLTNYGVRIAGGVLLLLTGWTVAREGMAEHQMFLARSLNDRSPAMAWESYRKAEELTIGNPDLLYQCLVRATNTRHDWHGTLRIYRKLRENTPIESFSNAPGHMGTALLRLGYPRASLEYFRKNQRNYPYLLIPLLNLGAVYQSLGMTAEQRETEELMGELIRIRDLTPDEFRTLIENQDYDLRPWDIPARKKRLREPGS